MSDLNATIEKFQAAARQYAAELNRVLLNDCPACEFRQANGRSSTTDPIHCHRCHATWTGNEAQHCTVCCQTFYSIRHADLHEKFCQPGRTPKGRAGWCENRPGVWVFREDGAEAAGSPHQSQQTAPIASLVDV